MGNVRCRLILDKGFLKFIKEKRDITKIAIVLALGLALIFLGNLSKEKTPESEDAGIEERLTVLCSGVDGVGDCSVLVYYTPSSDEVESVIVICEGADDVRVRLRLTEMLSSFFGIGANRIRIEKMKV
jgi:hypothetical protein